MPAPKDSKHVIQQKVWLGISDLIKQPSSQDPDQPTLYWYSENLNVRSDPYAPTLNPATQKESGSTVTDLLIDADITPAALTTYLYGNQGNIYSRTLAGSWAKLHTAANSHGNGLEYFYGDDYLYYAGDTAIGRYGPLASSPTFSDDFLTAQGGIPQNTNSLSLVAASSQYASAADSATLSITDDLTLESYFFLNSLPAVGSSMTILGKWDESGTLRSYIMDIFGVSGFFGDGSDGPLTISVDTTDSPIDSACTGTAGNQTLSATNASFAVGQVIFIWQTQGTNAGQWERNTIQGYTAGTITLNSPLLGSYTSGAQVIVMKQYTNVTINNGVTWHAKQWNGTTGGILVFLYNGTLTNNGTISTVACGFRGGAGISSDGTQTSTQTGNAGEGSTGPSVSQFAANGNGGGGGQRLNSDKKASGGGGGNANAGSNGSSTAPSNAGVGGNSVGTADLTAMLLGGGGGSGTPDWPGGNTSGDGGRGGGIFNPIGVTFVNNGTIVLDGSNGSSPSGNDANFGSGGGAAGNARVVCQTFSNSGTITLFQGSGSAGHAGGLSGGDGSVGRFVVDYLTSFSDIGTITVTANYIQDNTLVTTTTYQARLGISNNGTSFEYLTKNLNTLTTGQYNRLSVSWTASSSLATFYLNGSPIGTTVGTKTAIHDNTSLLYLGAKHGALAVGSFLDGLIDDVRIWNAVQSANNIYLRNNIQLTGNEGGLAAYYKLNASTADSGPNANTLTLHSATYSTTVPFVDPTTRLDIDQSYTTTGSTYAVPTVISEATADQLPFTPANDPQKSMDINIAAKGTGDWTITIHDQTNAIIASKTITAANMASAGYQEFVWASPWRIVLGKSYHAHITSTVNDGTIVTSSSNVLQTGGNVVADFHTYFQFLITDTQFHPIQRWLNFIAIGNERYIAKWDGAFYQPNLIAFPPGTHVRCIGQWGIYLAIGVWQEAASGTPNIYDFGIGKIYFWDGISLTFNFAIDVPEGQVNAIFGMDSDLYYFAGYKADLLYYQGSWSNQSGSFNGTKVKRIPYLELAKYAEIYPHSMANWQGLLNFGMAANTNSSTFPNGVYSWGALYPSVAKSLSFDHIISTGNKDNTVRIGMIYPVGQKLLVGWQDGISYGCDVIDPTGGVYHTSGQIQTNILDGGEIWRNDLYLKIRADHLTLNTGEGVKVGYKLDREANFETSNSVTDTLKQVTTNTPMNGRSTEAQLQAILTGNGTSSPTLLQLGAQVDNLPTEMQY